MKQEKSKMQEDSDVVHVCFRRILHRKPKFNVGDHVKTTFETEGRIVEVLKIKTGETVYRLDDGKLYHPSAIIGFPKQKAKQTTLF